MKLVIDRIEPRALLTALTSQRDLDDLVYPEVSYALRTCLCCGKKFKSYGIQNRMCDNCKRFYCN